MRTFPLSFLSSLAVAATMAACGGGSSASPSAAASSPAASKPAAASVSAKPAASAAASASAKPAASGAAASARPAASGATGSAAAKPAPSLAPATTVAILKVQDTSLGKVLADDKGKTLYSFDEASNPASKDATKCVTACLGPWPPLLSSDAPTAPAGVTGKLGVIARPEGPTIKQVTYNDMPLYYFVQDQAAGDVKGQGSKGFGGNWQVIKVG